jgi:undecaprenyl diphosphate synthase
MQKTAPFDDKIIPSHVAIIMDGNGRWAKQRHKPRLFGHKAGVESVRLIVETARKVGVRHLTLYAFSTENWQRPAGEVSGLMKLLEFYLESELKSMLKDDIRLCCLGEKERLPDSVRNVLVKVISETVSCSGMTLNLALSYGGRNEMIRAVRKMAGECVRGELTPDSLSEDMLSNYLDTAGQPDPDLLIRTGGEQRLSNFMLWQASYAELYFTDIPWPDFRKENFLEAIAVYGCRQRRFGGIPVQV